MKSAPTRSAALFVVLVVLLILRAAGAFAPSPYLWAFDLQAHLHPVLAWAPWLLAALALVPAVSVPVERRLARLSPGIGLAIALGVVLVTIVLVLPDKLRFVGDAQLRFGNLTVDEDPVKMFPQATPLDLLLHFRLPRALGDRLGIARPDVAYAMGCMWAIALAALAAIVARVCGTRGPVALATAAAVAFGGTLALTTGYLKAFVELSLLTGFAGVAALRLARDGRGLLMLGLAVAGALLLHRSALALVPLLLVAWTIALGPRRAQVPWRSPATWIGIAAPLAALAFMLPRSLATLRGFDVPHHLDPGASGHPAASVTSALEPHHLVDIANVLIVLAPLALAIPALISAFRRERRLEAIALGALLLPWLAVVLVIRPQQGLYRDWDVFTPAGIALALIVAWQLADALPRARAGLAVAATLAVAAPAFQWVALQHDVVRSLARIESRLDRTRWVDATERAVTLDFVGLRYLGLSRTEDANRAFMHAVEAAPNPRVIVQWGMAALTRGDFVQAHNIFQRAAVADSNLPGAWRGLMTAASALGDRAELARATEQLERLVPDDPMIRDARAVLAQPEQR